MRNGSNPEYFHVEGGLKLTRMRQSEWRRRWGAQGIVVLDLQVGASLDDGWSHPNPNTFNATHSQVIIGHNSAGENTNSWMRFQNVTIPGGATITIAYLTLMSAVGPGPTIKTNIFADDIDSAVAPTSKAEHDALNRTTASTAWDDVSQTDNTEEQSPSIVNVIQEVVDRGSWSSGNALQILHDEDDTTGNNSYRFDSYNGSASDAPKLHVEYTT